jgi:hypothetical protein
MGQIIRGRIFPLFTRPDKNTKKKGRKAKTPGKRESSHPPETQMAGRKTQQQQLKLKAKSNGNSRNN